jgi:hypothetical protein
MRCRSLKRLYVILKERKCVMPNRNSASRAAGRALPGLVIRAREASRVSTAAGAADAGKFSEKFRAGGRRLEVVMRHAVHRRRIPFPSGFGPELEVDRDRISSPTNARDTA